MKPVILASASPRRRELLSLMGVTFSVRPSGKEEVITTRLPEEAVQQLSMQKALDIAGQSEEDCIVIGADTVVACENRILGKPGDEREAFDMLKRLQGRTHQVYTGVTVVEKEAGESESFTFYARTDVTLCAMEDREIEGYIAAGESLDKAGAYGIQGRFAVYVEQIRGEYNNVVGLPVARLYHELKSRRLI